MSTTLWLAATPKPAAAARSAPHPPGPPRRPSVINPAGRGGPQKAGSRSAWRAPSRPAANPSTDLNVYDPGPVVAPPPRRGLLEARPILVAHVVVAGLGGIHHKRKPPH